VNPILNTKELAYLSLSDQIPWQRQILAGIKDIYENSKQENGETDILSTVYRLWGILYKHLDVKAEEIYRDENLTLMKRLLDYLYKNYNQKLTLKELCNHAGIGKNKCTELFRRYTNMSPMEYLRHYRVEKGALLLRETDMTVTEIAYETGFSGASYFAESLRQHRGCSPSQLRRNKE